MNDNKTVQELLEPIDREYTAWRKFVEAEEAYNARHQEEDDKKEDKQ